MTNNLSDRVAGVILLLVAIWYSIEASTLKSSILSDNLGPSAFPLFLGILLGILSLYMIIKPDVDPQWPDRSGWIRMGLIILSFIVYAYIMEPFGFVIATTFEMVSLAYVFKGPRIKSVVTGFLFSLFLFGLFSYVLSLSLPTGTIFESLGG